MDDRVQGGQNLKSGMCRRAESRPACLRGPVQIVAVMLLTAALSTAAEIHLESGTVLRGETIMLAVTVKTNGVSVTALQFDLEYDPEVLEIDTTMGAAARAAAKEFEAVELADGQMRLLLYGMNHNDLPDGEMMTIVVRAKPDATEGRYWLRLKSALATNAVTEPLLLDLTDGIVTVN